MKQTQAEATPRSVTARAVASDDETDQLVARFAHRVRFFVHRIERRYGLAPLWRDDLTSAGYWGLLKALRNRRLDAHEHELSAYVSQRIEGAVLDEARRTLGHLANRAPGDPLELELAGVELAAERTPSSRSGGRVPDPECEADRSARWRAVERGVAGLSAVHRELLFTVASGHSVAEIARRDGSSPARLQDQLQRAARQVRARAPELRRILREDL